MARTMTAAPMPVNAQNPGAVAKILRESGGRSAKMLTANKRCTYPWSMQQTEPGDLVRSAGGGAMSKASSAKDRVDSALSRLESMVEERLRSEQKRSDELAKRLSRLEQHHEELKKVATDVEGRLERAMEYIRSLLAADQN
jgi:TolA-binding protein